MKSQSQQHRTSIPTLRLSRNISPFVTVILAAIVAGLMLAINATTDDAYILYRYVSRFTHGFGLTFNNGERVEGFSSPLWLLIVSAFGYVTGLPPEWSARLLGIACMVVSILLAFRLLRELSPPSWDMYAGLAILLGLTPGIWYYSEAGLEGPLLSLLLLLVVFFESRGRWLLSTIGVALVAITRPEGLLYVAAWIAFIVFVPKHRHHLTVRTLGALLPFACWEGFRFSYYHMLLPNTAIAKAWDGFGSMGIPYLARWGGSLLGPLIVIPFIKGFWKERVQFAPIHALFIAFACANVAFVIDAKSDWMLFGMFVAPAFPIIAIVYVSWFFGHTLLDRTLRRIALVLLAVSSLFSWADQAVRYARNEGLAMLMRSSDQLVVGKWLASEYLENTRVATGRLGGLSYAAPTLVIWDFGGLTDSAEAVYRSKGSIGVDPICARYPDVIAEADVPAAWSYRNDGSYIRWLKQYYSLQCKFQQGNFGTMDI